LPLQPNCLSPIPGLDRHIPEMYRPPISKT
jgi:hypothetical protein